MDCYLNEGIKVLYRVAMAILLLFHKHSTAWTKDIAESGVDSALAKFANQIPVKTNFILLACKFEIDISTVINLESIYFLQVGPRKLLRVSFGIRGLSSAYIFRVFTKTEMTLKARTNVMSNSRQLHRSRSSENLPTSQSQLSVQMMSHTLTIREVRPFFLFPNLLFRVFKLNRFDGGRDLGIGKVCIRFATVQQQLIGRINCQSLLWLS